MCAVNMFFVFLSIVSVLLLMPKMNMLAENNLQSIFTDDAFVSDDICSSVINEHPCVKNILEVLVKEINLLKITSNEMKISSHEMKISSDEKIQKVDEQLKREMSENKQLNEHLKRELSESKREIKFLKRQLKRLKPPTLR